MLRFVGIVFQKFAGGGIGVAAGGRLVAIVKGKDEHGILLHAEKGLVKLHILPGVLQVFGGVVQFPSQVCFVLFFCGQLCLKALAPSAAIEQQGS